jgi:hypothetical protein
MIKNFSGFESKEGAWGHRELAVSLMALSRWEEAIDAWKGCINHFGSGNIGFLILAYCYLKVDDISNAYISFLLNQRNKLDYHTELKPIRVEIDKLEGLPEVFKMEDRGKYDLVDINFRYYERYKSILLNKNLIGHSLRDEDISFIKQEAENHLQKYNIGIK